MRRRRAAAAAAGTACRSARTAAPSSARNSRSSASADIPVTLPSTAASARRGRTPPAPRAAPGTRTGARENRPPPPRARTRAPPRRPARVTNALDSDSSVGSSPRRSAAVQGGVVVAGPFRPQARGLQLGQPFGEPARDARARQLDREHVRQLVRQHHPPVEGVVRRRLRGDDTAEADAGDADAGQARRADRELVRIAVKLEDHRARAARAVAGDEVAVALLQVGRDDLRDGGAAGGGNAKAQARAGDRGVAGGDHLLEQVQQVVGADVVGVALPGAAEGVEAGVLVAQPQQRHRQHRQAACVVGIGGDPLARDVARVVVAAVVRQRLGDEREERAVVRA